MFFFVQPFEGVRQWDYSSEALGSHARSANLLIRTPKKKQKNKRGRASNSARHFITAPYTMEASRVDVDVPVPVR